MGPSQAILTLTAVTMSAVAAEDTLMELMAYRPAALYIAWLLGRRQQRAERLLAAISCLDAPGRLAVMLLDFYTRLRRKRLISGSTYNLPLNQVQIGQYLGLTMVHINRVLRSLREARIVSLEKHCVTILDLEGLIRLADSGGTASLPSGGVGKNSLIEIALPAGGEGGSAAPIALEVRRFRAYQAIPQLLGSKNPSKLTLTAASMCASITSARGASTLPVVRGVAPAAVASDMQFRSAHL